MSDADLRVVADDHGIAVSEIEFLSGWTERTRPEADAARSKSLSLVTRTALRDWARAAAKQSA